jgi:hypothetical protein
MMATQSNLRSLRSALLGFSMLSLIGVVLGTSAISDYIDARESRQSQLEAIRVLNTTVASAKIDLEQAKKYHKGYEAVVAKGIVGAFPKTIELDRFEAMIGRQPVTLLRYELSGQVPIAVTNAAEFSPFRPLRHELVFEVHPLHEEHFVSMTDWLERELGGLQAIEQCTLARAESRVQLSDNDKDRVTLTAKCQLNWYVFSGSAAINATIGSAVTGARSQTISASDIR